MSEATGSSAGAILEIDALQLGPIGTNCYLLRDVVGRDAVVVDPGDEPERVLALVQERDVDVRAILVTHCHWDHIGAVAAVQQATGAEVWMSRIEAPVMEAPDRMPLGGPRPIDPANVDHLLDGGERIVVAGITMDVLHTPGHSPGSLTFCIDGIHDASGDGWELPPIALVGDVIFQGSVGRTDLPFADPAELDSTLSLLVRRLDPATVLCSGHGPVTTMAAERATNPFLRGR